MTADWQSLVAICIVLACTAWIVRYLVRPFARVAQVCRKCESSAAAEETDELLQIEPPRAPKSLH